MQKPSSLYSNLIPRPLPKDTPWANKGAGYTKAIEASNANSATKQTVQMHLDKALQVDWGACQLDLTAAMFGETFYAAAALAIYQQVAPNTTIKIFHVEPPQRGGIFLLQQQFLSAIDPHNVQTVQAPGKREGTVTSWAQVNEFLFPKYILLHPEGPKGLHTLLRERFLSQPLRNACGPALLTWLQTTKQVQANPKTVGVWIRSKVSNEAGDAVNNLTQEHYQHILTILRNNGVEQVVLLGDQPAIYSVSPQDIAQAYGFPLVVNLLDYHRSDPNFLQIVQNAQAMGGSMACQLLVCDLLRTRCSMKFLIGKKSGGLDGPTMVGVPQIFFEVGAASASRMGFTSFLDTLWTQVPLELERRTINRPITTDDREAFFTYDEQTLLNDLISRVFRGAQQ